MNYKKQKFLILFCTLFICSSFLVLIKTRQQDITGATPAPSVQGLDQYELVFSDEFNDVTLNRSKWSTCYDWAVSTSSGCTNYGNNEDQWYRSTNVSLNGGSLHLLAEQRTSRGTDTTGHPRDYPYTSGMVGTGGAKPEGPRWLNKYGYYEIKMHAPSGAGIWPAFWLLPTNGKWPPEIDIMEILGDKTTEVLNTYFWRDSPNHVAKDSASYNAKFELTNSWHTYGLKWEKGSLIWYLDGKAIRTITSRNVPDEQMAMVINLAVGGTLPGHPNKDTKFPAELLVDYVRVFKRLRP